MVNVQKVTVSGNYNDLHLHLHLLVLSNSMSPHVHMSQRMDLRKNSAAGRASYGSGDGRYRGIAV